MEFFNNISMPSISLPPVPTYLKIRSVTVLRIGVFAGTVITWLSLPNANMAKSLASDSNFIPLLFRGFIGVATIETLGVIYEISRRILGDRDLFYQLNPEEAKELFPLDRCRYRVWKVYFWVEKTVGKIDHIYSRIFNVRTEEEIKDKSIRELDLTYMELARIAFKEQVQETINEEYPSTGYTVFLINFTLGLTDKINALSNRIQIEKIQEKREIKKKLEEEGKEEKKTNTESPPDES